MIVGIGLDLIEPGRLAQSLEQHGERFEQRVFTPAEIADCAPRADRVQALAVRFAAKEACMKALRTGWSRGLGFRQIEVVRTGDGPPEIKLTGAAAERAREMGVKTVHVTLTHQPSMAAAVVILEA